MADVITTYEPDHGQYTPDPQVTADRTDGNLFGTITAHHIEYGDTAVGHVDYDDCRFNGGPWRVEKIVFNATAGDIVTFDINWSNTIGTGGFLRLYGPGGKFNGGFNQSPNAQAQWENNYLSFTGEYSLWVCVNNGQSTDYAITVRRVGQDEDDGPPDDGPPDPPRDAQTITSFTATPGTGHVGCSATLTATTSSDLEVIFGTTTPELCEVADGKVNFLAPGDAVLTADQPGDEAFEPAPQVTLTMPVLPVPEERQPQTISSFTATSTLVSVGNTVTLTATASSGLPVAFFTSTPGLCEVVGDTVTFLALGDCILFADQPGDDAYLPAPRVALEIKAFIETNRTDQTITGFAATPPVGSVGGTAILTAAASSGLPITFGTLTPNLCTVTGNTVTFLGAGTCVLIANQAGDEHYSPAMQRVIKVAITGGDDPDPPGKTTQTITGFTATPEAGHMGTHPGVFAQLNATASSGLPVTFGTLTPELCHIEGNYIAFFDAAGTCVLTADQPGDNTFAQANQAVLLVTVKNHQIITAFDGPISGYVGRHTSLTATASSGLPVAFGTTTPGLCTVTGSTVTFTATGNAVLTANQAGNDRYDPAETSTISVTIRERHIMSIKDLVNAQNNTYYGDNGNRCTLFTEDGRQVFLVAALGTNTESVVPVYLDANEQGGNPAGFNYVTISDMASHQLVDDFTGVQMSLYNPDGTLKSLKALKLISAGNYQLVPVTAIDTETLEQIPAVLDSTLRGKVIWWYAMAAEPAVALGGLTGFEATTEQPYGHTLDFKSNRVHRRIQAKKFTVSFTSATDTPMKAIRLLQMNPQGQLDYINDTGVNCSNTNNTVTSGGDVSTLYAGNDGLTFINKRATNGNTQLSTTHGVTITFPNFVNVDALEIVGGCNNVTLSYAGIDGNDAMAVKVSGFELDNGRVLRMPIHDNTDDAIDVGPEYMKYNVQTAIRTKITANAPLELAEYMQLLMPTSNAVQLANLVAAGKTAKEIATINKALTARYFYLAAGALLVTH
jgi:hypothetical protein